MPGLVFWLGLGDLYEFEGYNVLLISARSGLQSGNGVISLNLKVTENVL